MSRAIWECKIGRLNEDLPETAEGIDFDMRVVVEEAYLKVTGKHAQFCISRWDGELTPLEREIAEEKVRLEKMLDKYSS